METVKQVLMRRDGLSASEANERISEFQKYVSNLIGSGGNLFELEDEIADEFGLEPDYLMEFLV